MKQIKLPSKLKKNDLILVKWNDTCSPEDAWLPAEAVDHWIKGVNTISNEVGYVYHWDDIYLTLYRGVIPGGSEIDTTLYHHILRIPVNSLVEIKYITNRK